MTDTKQTNTSHKPTSLPRYLQDFQWDIKDRLVALDHGASLAHEKKFEDWLALNTLSIGCFDPLKSVENASELEGKYDNFQWIDDGLLADGNAHNLYYCSSDAMSGTLAPLPKEQLPHNRRDYAKIDKRELIETMALNDVDALPNVDWLVLSGNHDHIAVLTNGMQKLKGALLFQIHIPILPLHQDQNDIASICRFMALKGYQLYRFNHMGMQSHFTADMNTERSQASQLATVDTLFVPDEKHLANLPAKRLVQLAFLLDTIYDIHDYTYRLLERVDAEMAHEYLAAKGYLNLYDGQPDTFELTPEYSPVPWDEDNPPWENIKTDIDMEPIIELSAQQKSPLAEAIDKA